MRSGTSQIVPRIISAIVLLVALWFVYGHRPAPANDLTEYWSSAHLLLARQNPYAPEVLGAMEKHLGREATQPLIMLNPPWIFAAILPLGLISYSTASLLWLWMNLLMILISTRLLWRFYADSAYVPAYVWLLIGLFLPIYVQLAIGQIGALILAGITVFLYAQREHKDVLAGLALFLVALKPHLAFLLWVALVLWVWQTRRWKIACSFALAMVAANLIPLIFDPTVFRHYGEVWKYGKIIWSGTPTLGGLLCLAFISKRWVAFIPFWCALAWYIFYWKHHRKNWDWLEETPLLLMVSVVGSPYAWFFDQVVLVPAIMQLAANSRPFSFQKWRWGLLVYAGVNLGILLFTGTNALPLFGPWFAWIAPAWLVLYAVIRWKKIPASSSTKIAVNS